MKEFKIYITDNMTNEERASVQSILNENLVKNGGTLRYESILSHNFAVLIKKSKEIIGYALLYPDFLVENDTYVMQTAIKKEYQGKGLGSKMYEFIKANSKPYSYFTANVKENNVVSLKLHKSQGFVEIGKDEEDGYCLIFDLQNVKKRKTMRAGVSQKFSLEDALEDGKNPQRG